MTPYQRRTGRYFSQHVYQFGECMFYRQLGKHEYKGESNWFEGVFLGTATSSNEYLLGTRSGVLSAFVVRRKPLEDRWKGEEILLLKGTPAQPDPNKLSHTIPIRVSFDPIPHDISSRFDDKSQKKVIPPKSAYIKPWMLEKWGYTDGCPECDRRKAGLKTVKAHSKQCDLRTILPKMR